MDTSIIIIVVLVVLLSLSIFLLIRNFKKVEIYQSWILRTKENATEAYLTMRQVDIHGVFEADDQVGFAFQRIKQIVTDLSSLIVDAIQEVENERKKADNIKQ